MNVILKNYPDVTIIAGVAAVQLVREDKARKRLEVYALDTNIDAIHIGYDANVDTDSYDYVNPGEHRVFDSTTNLIVSRELWVIATNATQSIIVREFVE